MNENQLGLMASRWKGTRNLEERTKLTDGAIAWAKRSLAAEVKEAQVEIVGASILIMACGYLTIVVGQPSWTAHGRQGLEPRRIAALRAFQCPVRIVFWEGAETWRAVWLGINEPTTRTIQNADKTRKRFGWLVKEMVQGDGSMLYWPEDVDDDAAKQVGAPVGLFA